MRKRIQRLGVVSMAVMLVTVGGLLGSATALADVTNVAVISEADLGTFKGRRYHEYELEVRGTAPGGAYRVPMTLAFPDRRPSGVALVDVINTRFVNSGFPIGNIIVPVARLNIGDDYIFDSGDTYIAVQWDKAAVAVLGVGQVAVGTDAWEIIRDASELVRRPGGAPLPAAVAQVAPASTVVVFGHSQTALLLREFYRRGLNAAEGDLVFDGAIMVGALGNCFTPGVGSANCGGPLTDGGKTIAISAETDVEWGGYAERGDHPDYRVYEVASVAHLGRDTIDLTGYGAPAQLPFGFSVVARAAYRNIVEWIERGVAPPPSVYMASQNVSAVLLGGRPFIPVVRDSDGNGVGGVRLPHTTSQGAGNPAGAPLGTYRGLDTAPVVNLFIRLAGVFTPFSAAELASRYPSHGDYVQRVSRAAISLALARYILLEDANGYSTEAAQSHF